MTKKDFDMLSRLIRASYEYHTASDSPSMAEAVRMLAYDMANELRGCNPRFDLARFLDACGVR